MLDKVVSTEYQRIFLAQQLPDTHTPASQHVQLFDNYVLETRFRLRSCRTPETKGWSHYFQQIEIDLLDGSRSRRLNQFDLTESEYPQFGVLEGNEIRKNRYRIMAGDNALDFDIFLGRLWGLNVVTARFDNEIHANEFDVPSIAVMEVTLDEFFREANLVTKTFSDIQVHAAEVTKKKAV